MARLALAAVFYLAALGWCSLGDAGDEECAASPLSGGESTPEGSDFDTSYLQLSRSRLGTGSFKGKANAEALNQMFEIVKSEVGSSSYSALGPDVVALIEKLIEIIDDEILTAIKEDFLSAQERIFDLLTDLQEASQRCDESKTQTDKACGDSYDDESKWKDKAKEYQDCNSRKVAYETGATDYCTKTMHDSSFSWELPSNKSSGECDLRLFCNGKSGDDMGHGDAEYGDYIPGTPCGLNKDKNWCDSQTSASTYQNMIGRGIEDRLGAYHVNCVECDKANKAVANESSHCQDLEASAGSMGRRSDELVQNQLIAICGWGLKYQTKCAALALFVEIVEQTRLDSSNHEWSEPERQREWLAVNMIRCVIQKFKDGTPIDGGNYSDPLFDVCQKELGENGASYSTKVGVMNYHDGDLADVKYVLNCEEVHITFGHFKYMNALPKVYRPTSQPPFDFCLERILPSSIPHCPPVAPDEYLECDGFDEGHQCEYHETCCPGEANEIPWLAKTATCTTQGTDKKWKVSDNFVSRPSECQTCGYVDSGCCFSMEFTDLHKQPCCLQSPRYEETQSECTDANEGFPDTVTGWAARCPGDKFEAAKWLGLHLPSNTCPKHHGNVKHGSECQADQAGMSCTYMKTCCLGSASQYPIVAKTAKCDSGYNTWDVTEMKSQCQCSYGKGYQKDLNKYKRKKHIAALSPYKELGCPNRDDAMLMEGIDCHPTGAVCGYKKICCPGTYLQGYFGDFDLVCQRNSSYHDVEQVDAWKRYEKSQDCPKTCPNPNDDACPHQDDIKSGKVKIDGTVACEGTVECEYDRECCAGGVTENRKSGFTALDVKCENNKWVSSGNQSPADCAPQHKDKACLQTYPAWFMSTNANEELKAGGKPDRCPVLADDDHYVSDAQEGNCDLYTEITKDVMKQVNAVENAKTCKSEHDSSKSNRHKTPICPTADWIGCIVRFAGHDFMDRVGGWAAGGSGGADACMKMKDPDNKGVEHCMWSGEHGQRLSSTWAKYCTQLSLADFTVIAAEAVITWARKHAEGIDPFSTSDSIAMSGLNFINIFRFGRTTSRECPKAPHLPGAEQGCSEVQRVFVNGIGLTWRESAALMGVHTLGQAHPDNSGFEGPWASIDHANKFDNHYYKTMVMDGWVQFTNENGKSWWKKGTVPEIDTDGEIMLDTDLCFFYNVASGLWGQNSEQQGCCAWSYSHQRLGNGKTLGDYGGEDMCRDATPNKAGFHTFPDKSDTIAEQHGYCCKAGGGGMQQSAGGANLGEKDNCATVDPEHTGGTATADIAEFQHDEHVWLKVFQQAWWKATEAGHKNLFDKLSSCKVDPTTPYTPPPYQR